MGYFSYPSPNGSIRVCVCVNYRKLNAQCPFTCEVINKITVVEQGKGQDDICMSCG